TERRKREMEIRDYREKLRLLALKLSRTEELERRKLAAFLHDQIGQKLALAKIELGTLSESAAEGKVVEDQVRKLRKLIEDTIKDTRQLTFELNPPLLDQLGLEGSLKWLIDQYREKYKLQCNFTDDGQPKPLAKNLPSALFQSVKELLLNVLKHAQADKADVEVGRVGNKIQIRVKDNGVGFDPSERKPYSPQSAGFGLFHIKERLKDYNGGLDIKSEKGKGTKVVLWGPLAVSKKTFD
ncbi:MAG: sensor histidine kinase, partial [Candidatus Aminicenantales bacterium]